MTAAPARTRARREPRRLLFVMLVTAAMGTAIAVVYVKHETRKLFVDLHNLQKSRDDMNVEWGQLQLEQSTWESHGRLEGAAREKLGMMLPTADRVVIVRP